MSPLATPCSFTSSLTSSSTDNCILRFAELYVRGFLTGGGYDQIPLERNAYLLGGEFDRDRTRVFRVADVVATWIREARF